MIQRTAGDNLHPSSQLAQSLMMGAVYYHDFPVQVMQEAAGQIVYFMVLIRVQIAVTVGTGQILDDAAAQPYIDDLHSLADAQNGDAALYAVFRACSCRISSSVSMEREPRSCSPKKRG